MTPKTDIQELTEAVQSLEPFVDHKKSCNIRSAIGPPSDFCTCGVDDVIETVDTHITDVSDTELLVPVSDEMVKYIKDWAEHEEKDPENIAGLIIERALNEWRHKYDFEPLETIHNHDRSKETMEERHGMQANTE